MKLANLETFVTLAQLRHFGRTAEQLHTTQPAISSRIMALERELGTRLVERENRRVHLTPAGLEALHVIETMLKDFDELKLRFADPTHIAATLRVGVIDAVVQTWLPRFYDRIRTIFPSVGLEIIVDSTVSLLAALRAGDLDMTVCLEPVLEDGYRSFVICTYAMSWIGSPKLVDQDRTYSVGELAQLPLITFQRNSPPYRMIAPYFLDESVLASQLSKSNSLPTMIRLAQDGFGIAAVPTLVVEAEVAAAKLVSMKVDKPFPPLTFVASYYSGRGTAVVQRAAEVAKDVVALYCTSVGGGLAWS